MLLDHNLIAKVADFGLSRKTYVKNYARADITERPVRWFSPEVLKTMCHTERSDVWSFGVTIWEMFHMCATIPYENLTDRRVEKFITDGGTLERPEYSSAEV